MCWVVPMRPVAPLMMTPIWMLAMFVSSELFSRGVMADLPSAARRAPNSAAGLHGDVSYRAIWPASAASISAPPRSSTQASCRSACPSGASSSPTRTWPPRATVSAISGRTSTAEAGDHPRRAGIEPPRSSATMRGQRIGLGREAEGEALREHEAVDRRLDARRARERGAGAGEARLVDREGRMASRGCAAKASAWRTCASGLR